MLGRVAAPTGHCGWGAGQVVMPFEGERMAKVGQKKAKAADFRIERDFLGEKRIPADAYYGVQTQRGKDNFHITGIPMSVEPNFVKAFGYVKKAAALANRDLGVLDKKVANAIAKACDRVIAGEFRD